MKIIKDIKGGKLRLSKLRLTELTGYCHGPYFLLLKDLKEKVVLNKTLTITGVKKDFDKQTYFVYNLNVDPASFQIGCRIFSKQVFAQILKAAGVK